MNSIKETIERNALNYSPNCLGNAYSKSYEDGCADGARLVMDTISDIIKWPPGENEVKKILRIEQFIKETRNDLQ